ncbi:MAG: hypothetical protein L6Q92_16135 [Phycisphaerae bacterium]|nr:hypothetical protein [Phycisphaerae bacterium]
MSYTPTAGPSAPPGPDAPQAAVTRNGNPREAAPLDLQPPRDGVPHDIACPLCTYNLRGLTEPRCPECGYRFEWAEVLQTWRRRHPFLFEHHPDRNLWSFWKTFRAGFKPRTFWRGVQPVQTVHIRRLIRYWLVVNLVFLAIYILNWFILVPLRWVQFQTWSDYAKGGALSLLIVLLLEGVGMALGGTRVLLVPFLWPWLVVVGLSVFQQSMRRARVSSRHVIRSAIYGTDALLLLWPLGIAFDWASFFTLAYLGRSTWWTNDNWRVPTCCVAVLLCVAAAKLTHAYRHYMRMDHPRLTILAAHVVAVLLLLNILLLQCWLT